VLEVEGAAVPNARLIVNHTPEMQDQAEKDAENQEQRDKEEAAAQINMDIMDATT